MRLLAAAAHLNEKVCVPLTHKLFGSYWVDNKGTVLIRKCVGKQNNPVLARLRYMLCSIENNIETLLSGVNTGS